MSKEIASHETQFCIWNIPKKLCIKIPGSTKMLRVIFHIPMIPLVICNK